MSRSDVPASKLCFNPVLQAVRAYDGEATNKEIYDWVVTKLELTNEQLAILRKPDNPGFGTKIGHHIDFAKTILKNVGLLNNPRRGVWGLSAIGKETRGVDPDVVQRQNAQIQKDRKGLKQRRQQTPYVFVDPPEKYAPKPTQSEQEIPFSDSEPETNRQMDIESYISHEEIQWLLLSLGNEMGIDLWVASNDRNKSFQDNVFSKIPRLRRNLPIQFDQRTQRIVELIDVLWLQGNSIIAAFEIEHTTSVFSGLLRMSDLIALQPNLNINLFIVAPDVRRDKVKSEINRPTFAKLNLPKWCRYIAYSRLTQKIDQATRGGFLRHLSPSILDELAEVMDK